MERHRRHSRLILLLLVAAAIAAVALNRDKPDPTFLDARLAGFGMFAPLADIAHYAIGTVLFAPGSLLALAGGALNVPPEDVGNRLAEMRDRAAEPVIAVCRTDRRSAAAEIQLRDAGFENLSVPPGGMVRRIERGLVVSGARRTRRRPDIRECRQPGFRCGAVG